MALKMTASATKAKSSDFVIWGPSVTAGTAVLHAVHALYYLPGRFKLVLPAVKPEDQDAYARVVSLIQRDGLADRVVFSDKQVPTTRQAVIATDSDDTHPGYIFGATPEALASAILQAARREI